MSTANPIANPGPVAGATSAPGMPAQPTAADGRPPETVRRLGSRLPPPQMLPPEKMSLSQLMHAQHGQQAMIGLEAEVRRLGRLQGLDLPAAQELGRQARVAFRIVEGEPIPVAEDRQTVLLAADGINVLSVEEWVVRQLRQGAARPRTAAGRFAAVAEDEVLPQPNPFRRKTWNLTAQMRLLRRDPKLARRLKAEAVADGDH